VHFESARRYAIFLTGVLKVFIQGPKGTAIVGMLTNQVVISD